MQSPCIYTPAVLCCVMCCVLRCVVVVGRARFARNHYLSSKLANSANCYILTLQDDGAGAGGTITSSTSLNAPPAATNSHTGSAEGGSCSSSSSAGGGGSGVGGGGGGGCSSAGEVGFVAVMTMCAFPHSKREHRTVVLPDFQGMGIGTRLSDAVAQVGGWVGGRKGPLGGRGLGFLDRSRG